MVEPRFSPVIVADTQSNTWVAIPVRKIIQVVIPKSPEHAAEHCLIRCKGATEIHVSYKDAGRAIMAQQAVAIGNVWHDSRAKELFPSVQ